MSSLLRRSFCVVCSGYCIWPFQIELFCLPSSTALAALALLWRGNYKAFNESRVLLRYGLWNRWQVSQDIGNLTKDIPCGRFTSSGGALVATCKGTHIGSALAFCGPRWAAISWIHCRIAELFFPDHPFLSCGTTPLVLPERGEILYGIRFLFSWNLGRCMCNTTTLLW